MKQNGGRLSAATKGRVLLAAVPTYQRPPQSSIAHIGVGAFARAHLAVYADDLLRAGVPMAIRGVSLHNRDPEERLVPQDCYYTVAEREPDSDSRLRIVGSLSSVASGATAALEALTAPATRLVTLSITEKGYDPNPGDLERPQQPTSAAGLLSLALFRRRRAGLEPPLVLSLDNVSHNGDLLRTRTIEVAAHLDPALPDWISTLVRFPNSVVDRMVPATTGADLEEVATQLGLRDFGAVSTEHHRSWVVEADDRLQPFGEVGTELVGNISPYEERKLWLLNGPHSAVAYGGLLFGYNTIAEAVVDESTARFVHALVDDVLEVADLPPSLQAPAFAASALRRFANPHLRHTCIQVAADGSRKLPQRFRSVVEARRNRGLGTQRFATIVAIWVAATAGVTVAGRTLPPIDDPEARGVRSSGSTDLRHLIEVALRGTFDGAFKDEVAVAVGELSRQGEQLLRDLA